MTSQTRVALVTGASRGIGAWCAIALGRAGFKVIVHYNSQAAKAEAVCQEIQGAVALQADISDLKSCDELMKTIKSEHGGVDVLVNNAGICIDQVLAFAKPEDFSKLLQVNLQPVFYLSKLASRQMLRKRWGRIINLSSVVGYSGNAGQSMYAATKAAITGFTKSIAIELAPAGILINTVAPGFIATDMTSELDDKAKDHILTSIPLKRMGRPDEIASVVKFLASEEASYITGSTIHVNGGMFTS